MSSVAAAPRRSVSPVFGGRLFAVVLLGALMAVAGPAAPAASQVPADMPDRLAVFLDCGFCDETFIRQEMTYVDYVRDREVAHLHILVTRQDTGAGGEATTFDLIGRG